MKNCTFGTAFFVLIYILYQCKPNISSLDLPSRPRPVNCSKSCPSFPFFVFIWAVYNYNLIFFRRISILISLSDSIFQELLGTVKLLWTRQATPYIFINSAVNFISSVPCPFFLVSVSANSFTPHSFESSKMFDVVKTCRVIKRRIFSIDTPEAGFFYFVKILTEKPRNIIWRSLQSGTSPLVWSFFKQKKTKLTIFGKL